MADVMIAPSDTRDGRAAALSPERAAAIAAQFQHLAGAFREAGRQSAAEAVLLLGMDLLDRHPGLLLDYARSAEASGDHESAVRRYAMLRHRSPVDAAGYLGEARALCALDRHAEADAILEQAAERLPENPEILSTYAWLGQTRREWDAASRRWRSYRDRFPDHVIGYAVGSISLVELGRFAEADTVLQQGLIREPGHAELLGNYAWVAHRQSNWPEAMARWQTFRDRFPDNPAGYANLGVVLRELKRYEEADAVLLDGLRRHPTHPELVGNYAWVAYYRQDWPEALKRWTAFRDLMPDHSLGHSQVMLIMGELGRFDEIVTPAPRLNGEDPSRANLAEFMLQFESLGDNCEFGVVQRHFGAEPLGLLRFTSTPLRLLAAALESRFEGVGDPANTDLKVVNGEYMTTDKRFLMAMHTFIRETGDDREKRLVSVCRRLRFLRDKLLADLTEANKIFVYGCTEPLDDEAIQPLWRAIRSYGNNRLLLVRAADNANPSGSVRRLAEGFAAGYVDQLDVAKPSFDVWLDICVNATSLLRNSPP